MNSFSYAEDEWKNNASDYEHFAGLDVEDREWNPRDDLEEEYDATDFLGDAW